MTPMRRIYQRPVSAVIAAGWSVCLLAGWSDVQSNLYAIGLDGMSYLNLARNALELGPGALVNGYWSPLYPVVTALCIAAGRLPLESQAAALHWANMVALVLALGGFTWLLLEILAPLRARLAQAVEAAFGVLGFGLFMRGFQSGVWMGTRSTTPDLLCAGLVLCAMALLARFGRGAGSMAGAGALGLALALAYLAKAAMLPVSVAAVAVMVLFSGGSRKAVRRTGLCLAVLAAAVAPWVLALSSAKGRFTFSDAGRLNFAWVVTQQSTPGNESMIPWEGKDFPNSPALIPGPVRMYEFDLPSQPVYALWYDPSWFAEGLKVDLDWRRLTASLARHAGFYAREVLGRHWVLLLPLLAAAWGAWRAWRTAADAGWWREWALLIYPLAALAMYAMVWTEVRYVAAFLVASWLVCAMICVRMAAERGWGLAAASASAALGMFLCGQAMWMAPARRPAVNADLAVAHALQALGVPPGSRIATVGSGGEHTYAYPGGLRITGQIEALDEEMLPALGPAERRAVVESLAGRGFRALVVRGEPPPAWPGWRRLAASEFHALVFE
ncbi:MAG: hypothetical protein HZB13_09480 [Acidobacteria bacterium]|nr:hypothetical protein [Acidobacteriota bacterium]